MKSWKEKYTEHCIRMADNMSDFLTHGGMYLIFGLGIIAIVMQIIGFHAKTGFSWTTFLLLEVPLYSFCIWALWQAWKMFGQALKIREENEKRKQEKLENKNENKIEL